MSGAYVILGDGESKGMAMILVGLGANLPHPKLGGPRATLEAALAELAAGGAPSARLSRWYESAPVPAADQPWFVNAVAAVETLLPPERLLALLHRVEGEFGRVRGVRNAARVIDLDLLAYGDLVQEGPPALPHPRLHTRAFVLLPLRDVAPGWVHPGLGRSVDDLLGALPAQQIRLLA